MTRPPSLDFIVAGAVRQLDAGRLRITSPAGEPITLADLLKLKDGLERVLNPPEKKAAS